MKTYLPTLAIVLLFVFTRTAIASTGLATAEKTDPGHSLQVTLDKISAFHRNDHRHDAFTLRHFIEQTIMPRFSFALMTRRVAGPYERYMTADDKTAFAARLRTDFLGLLIKHLGNFDPDSHQIQIDKTRYTQANRATVTVRVSFHQQQTIALSFRMQLIQHAWKIADIQSNGLSLVMFYRTRYLSRLRGYQLLAQ